RLCLPPHAVRGLEPMSSALPGRLPDKPEPPAPPLSLHMEWGTTAQQRPQRDLGEGEPPVTRGRRYQPCPRCQTPALRVAESARAVLPGGASVWLYSCPDPGCQFEFEVAGASAGVWLLREQARGHLGRTNSIR